MSQSNVFVVNICEKVTIEFKRMFCIKVNQSQLCTYQDRRNWGALHWSHFTNILLLCTLPKFLEIPPSLLIFYNKVFLFKCAFQRPSFDLRHIAISLYVQSTVQMCLSENNSPISYQIVIKGSQRNDFQDS